MDDAFASTKRLPDTPQALKARVLAFKEALRSERERALKAKAARDVLEARKKATLKAKNDRLAAQRKAREESCAEEERQREANLQHNRQQRAKGCKAAAAKQYQDLQALANEPLLDWENQEDIFEKQEVCLQAQGASGKRSSKTAPLRNTPTGATARPMRSPDIDERLVSEAEIQERWDKELLSGAPASVSLSLKKQRDRSGVAAQQQKYIMALCEEADHMMKTSLTSESNTQCPWSKTRSCGKPSSEQKPELRRGRTGSYNSSTKTWSINSRLKMDSRA